MAHFIYVQTTGDLLRDNMLLARGGGYMHLTVDMAGRWIMEGPEDTDFAGDFAILLAREDGLEHPDIPRPAIHEPQAGDAEAGPISFPREIREMIWASGETIIEVITA